MTFKKYPAKVIMSRFSGNGTGVHISVEDEEVHNHYNNAGGNSYRVIFTRLKLLAEMKIKV